MTVYNMMLPAPDNAVIAINVAASADTKHLLEIIPFYIQEYNMVGAGPWYDVPQPTRVIGIFFLKGVWNCNVCPVN